MSEVTWTYFGRGRQWDEDQVIRYTENWYGKSIFGFNMGEVAFHWKFSYVHHPELLKLTPLDSVFKVIEATIPKDYDSLEKAIEITNDLNRDFQLGEVVVTEAGVMNDDKAECKALMGRIAVEIDINLECMEGLKGIKMPDRGIKNPEYSPAFEKSVKRLYKIITGRACPQSIKSM